MCRYKVMRQAQPEWHEMEFGELRGYWAHDDFPDFATLHPGYALFYSCAQRTLQ